MGQITSLFVHKVIAQADDSLDKRAFLEAVGVDPDMPVDPKVMVEDTDYYEFFAYLTDGVQRALGREPKDFTDYAREIAASGLWRAVA